MRDSAGLNMHFIDEEETVTLDSIYDQSQRAAAAVLERVRYRPTMGVVLGSGLGAFVEGLADKTVIPYQEIPGFPVSKVHGHAGNLVFGHIGGKEMVVMQGRVHFYESGDMHRTTFPIRVLRQLGCTKMVVTNAAGAVNRTFAPGDLMLITDHINLMMGGGPLIGENDDRFGPRFPDMSEAYDRELSDVLRQTAQRMALTLREGVYCAFHGPEYETPAEIRMAEVLGADAVGMSTVPEVVVANHMGIRCAGVSCLSNMAAGINVGRLSHDDVMEVSATVARNFVELLSKAIVEMF